MSGVARALAGTACLALAACSAAPVAAPRGPETARAAAADPRAAGRGLYARHCLTCHQADGGGVPNMQPPIVGSTWVAGDARALALLVLTGAFDSAARKDSSEGNVMPSFAQLPDADLAGILTYVRAEFGKGASPVSAAQVAEARASMPR